MSDLDSVLTRWRKLMDLFQVEQNYRFALTGDGSSADTADIEGKPGWGWVRYDEKQDKASQVVNWRFPGIVQDVPVIIGKQYPTDRYYQVLGINLDLYLDHLTTSIIESYVVPRHGESHHGSLGNDPAPIDRRNLVFGKVQPTSPTSLIVYAEAFSYDADGTYGTFAGAGVDLTDYLPVVANTHRYVLVTVDSSTNTLAVTTSDPVPTPMMPNIPSVMAGHIPLAVVLLEQGITVIGEDRIYDYRVILGTVGGYLDVINQVTGALEAEVDFLLTDHMMRIQRNRIAVAIEESERDLQMSRHVVEGG